VPAEKVHSIFSDVLNPAELGFILAKRGTWARQIDADIFHVIKLDALKGGAYGLSYGLSLSYVPYPYVPQLKWHRTLKSVSLDLREQHGLQIEIFEKTGEHTLIQPTFAYAYPAEVSPLSRRNDQDPFIADRWEFFVGGRELANGFSELNDAEDQAQRFKDQVERKEAGDEEAMYYDADYVRALEYGMPPTAGLGLGVDRMVMLFTDSPSIRDVLLFPHMRPEA
jgi:aspartyl/asparaginyl-tRNA synthetase